MKQATEEKTIDQILADLEFCLEQTGESSVHLAEARLRDIRAGCRLAQKFVSSLRERLVDQKRKK